MAEKAGCNLVLVGAIAGAFGVHGEVLVRSFTGEPMALIDYSPLLDESGHEVLTIQSARAVKKGLAVTALEVSTREQAIALRNKALYVMRDRLPPVEADEFYHVDLIGLAVEALDGASLGRVRHVLAGPQDLLEIEKTPGASGRWFLPFTQALVPVVDVAGGRIVADVPAGLIPKRGDQLAVPPQPSEDRSVP